MEAQCSSFSWEFSTVEDGMEDLRDSLLYTTLELETTVISAKEEILRRESEIFDLKDLLSRAMREKDEVEAKYQKLMVEILMLQQQQKLQQQNQEKVTVATQSDSESKGSDCSKTFASFESEIESSQTDPVLQETISGECTPGVWKIACEKPLPEKGKLLQAVMESGPLLQTLLLAGPLPHWQHPPPLIDSIEIPPVVISNQTSCINIRKRSLLSGHPLTKYQKLVQ